MGGRAASSSWALPLLRCVACGGQGPSVGLGFPLCAVGVRRHRPYHGAGAGGTLARAPWTPPMFPPQLSSPMNPVSSSEDIKPPLGLNGVLKVPAHPSGNMASFTKHICAICGDRSSGRPPGGAGPRRRGAGLAGRTPWRGRAVRSRAPSPQASTMGCTAARAARASSSARCART